MLRLFRFLIFGDAHCHKWKIIQEIGVDDEMGDKIGKLFVSQCEICGKITHHRI